MSEQDRDFVKTQIVKAETREIAKLDKKKKWLAEKKKIGKCYEYKQMIQRSVQLRMDEIKKEYYPDVLEAEEKEEKKKKKEAEKRKKIEEEEKEEREAETMAKKGKFLFEDEIEEYKKKTRGGVNIHQRNS